MQQEAYLVTMNQAAIEKSGDARMYVLIWGQARVRPRPSDRQ